ncbi:hypothetical protein IFM89_008113 [Coptis chinensis]|uniref:Uncharacterized protein n=1 Tax=Coptis chinensis TaxID=261450 RepID=A0A835M9E0_9MAGN|nr:hypothetical protein IFM89_008113 [Coptis chinensis]
MATKSFRVIQDENMDVRYGGAAFGKGTNVSKPMKKAGLGGLKPLSNITNSGKPTRQEVLKKNIPERLSDGDVQCPQNSQKKLLSQGASVSRKSNVPDSQKKGGRSDRKALADISNSRQITTKNLPKKLDNIAEEQFLHDHQKCIDAQRKGMGMQCLLTTLGFDEDFSAHLVTPLVLPKSNQPKAYFPSPPRYLEYEEIPDLLNEAKSPPRSRTFELSPSPSPGHYPSPNLVLLRRWALKPLSGAFYQPRDEKNSRKSSLWLPSPIQNYRSGGQSRFKLCC